MTVLRFDVVLAGPAAILLMSDAGKACLDSAFTEWSDELQKG
jgi:hypothetical protein